MNAWLQRTLGARWLYAALLAANVFMLLVMGRQNIGGFGVDHKSYLQLAYGILEGSFSQWRHFDPPIPDTFRTPGYPLYIAAVVAVFRDWVWIGAVQLVMYIVSIVLAFRMLDRSGAGLVGRNVLLLLLAPSVNMTAVVFVVSPEIPVLFCMAVLAYVDLNVSRRGVLQAIGIGAILGFVFQCRPVYLLYPIAHTLVGWWAQRRAYAWQPPLITLLTFVITLLPFGFWNKSNHGVFSVTPLEGGGGVFNLGYWCGRIPGYPFDRIYGNRVSDEMVQFIPASERAKERAAYEREWDGIEARLRPLITHRDSVMIDSVGGRANVCYTFSTPYVLAREKEMKRLTWQHIGEHPWYYTAYKTYSAVRLWVVGVDRARFAQASWTGRAGQLFAFLFTFTIAFGGAFVIIRAHRKRLLALRRTWPLVLWVIYTTFIHLPFTIQTRYTISARFILYVLIAMAVAQLLAPAHQREPASHGTTA